MNENIQKTQAGIPIWKIIYKNLALIIVITILAGIAGFGYNALKVKPVYTASTSVMLNMTVSDPSLSTNTNNATLAKRYLPTIKEVITSPEVINKANYEIGNGKKIKISSVKIRYSDTSLIFSIGYSDLDKELAKEKLEVLISVAKIVLSQDDIIQADSIDLIPTQKTYNVSVYDGKIANVATSMVVGLILAIGLVFIMYFMDNTVKDKEEIEELTGVNVIAWVQNM